MKKSGLQEAGAHKVRCSGWENSTDQDSEERVDENDKKICIWQGVA